DVGFTGTVFNPGGTRATVHSINDNTTLAGWTAGAGYEWKPCCESNWSIKVEYMYYDFGSVDTFCCDDNVNHFNINNSDLTFHTVKVGFNYFFRPASAPLK